MQLKHINKYFYKYKYKLLLGVIITIIARVFALILPEYVQISIEAIETHIEQGNQELIYEKLWKYIIIIIVSSLLSGGFTFLMRQLIINISRYIEYDIKNEIYQKYQSLSQSFYKNNRVGDMMNRISEDVSKVRMYVGPAIMYSVQTATLFLCLIPLMFYTSVELTLYTILPLPFLSIFIYFLSRKIHQKTLVVQKFLSDLSVFSQEMFSGISVLKTYSLEEQTYRQMENLSQQGKQKSLDLARVQAWFLPSMTFLMGVSTILVMFIGGKLYIEGEIQSVGVIAKFGIYVTMLTWPVSSIGWVSSIIQQAEASQGRINDFLKITPEIQNHTQQSTPIQGKISFKNVCFTYPETGIKALNDASFEIEKGKFVAIIGKTGSGKSTIIDLITRIIQPDSGEIFIDDISVNELNLSQLRKSVSVVLQQGHLFSDTIEQNILMGNNQATFEQVKQAAQMAQVHQNIENFTDGYQSVLGEGGLSLSGGQRQRVLIARAILNDAEIYLFDDCLSAVDTNTEAQILENLKKIAPQKTKIIVSHRVSVARNADVILVIDNGKIVEQGTEQELYQKNGLYRTFYDIQTLKNNENN